MNRIYQGRIQRAEIQLGEGQTQKLSREDLARCDNNPIFRHHEVFQHAVNYYLVALGSLAEVSTNPNEKMGRLIRDLQTQLARTWDKFPKEADPRKPEPQSLGDSLRQTLSLPAKATLQDAFTAILGGKEETPGARLLALALLLDKCSGDAAIQQGGRGYLPRFVDSQCDPTWDFSPEALAAENGAQELARVLHGEPREADLEEVASRMQLSWTVKTTPGKFFEGAEGSARLTEALDHVAALLEEPSPRLAEALEPFSNPQTTILELKSDLPGEICIPRNRKANKDLTFASLLFQFFPSRLSAAILRQFLAKPKVSSDGAAPEIDFAGLGDDPIKLARGKRGYVFPAFTALPAWNPDSSGEPVWKEFDIAAFKEALKSLNQFSQQTTIKEDAKCAIEARLAYMTGTSESWTAPKSSSEEESESDPVRLAGDPRFQKAQELREALGSELEGDWGFTRSSLRGYAKIREQWENVAQAPSAGYQDQLELVVKTYQKDHRDDIGSVILFYELCKEEWREIWQAAPPTDEYLRAKDMLWAMCGLTQLERDLEKKSRPVNLTPAEPFHSRRLFMFSDIAGKSGAKIKRFDKNGELRIEVSIVAELKNRRFTEQRVLLEVTAPRLSRDQLVGDESSRWLQPMMEALEIEVAPPETKDFASAVALMPQAEIRNAKSESRSNPSVGLLLNFPVTLDSAWLTDALGKAERWRNQFNGTRERSLHLHWPGTATPACLKSPWWEGDEVRKHGFTALSYDFGQRTAGSWALLSVTTKRPETKRTIHEIGGLGETNWFADVCNTGMTKLPGEDRKESRGRKAEPSEIEEAKTLRRALGISAPDGWIDGISFPEQNDALLKIAARRLSRLNTFHRWSCAVAREDLIKRELEAYEDHQDWLQLLNDGKVDAFKRDIGAAFVALRAELEELLPRIANRTVPLRRRTWVWRLQRPDDCWKCLRMEDDQESPLAKIKDQRGLSFLRLEQLEKLRKLFLRLNRSLNRIPGEPAKFGLDAEGETPGEPCPDILAKLDRMKEERVNLTAHLMLAQALGLRLKMGDQKSGANPHSHGEYEKIPGRKPVDFIIIEDLERYRFSQGRAPSENSKLMKWSHRAVRDKLVMLCEPFGIPVVEVPPSYTSKICAETSRPGFRCREISAKDREWAERLAERKGKEQERWQTIARQMVEIESLGKPLKLIIPKAGGPLFVAVGKDQTHGKIRQADINAAINIGLRAIAAPKCYCVHSKIRTEPKAGKLAVVRQNKREKAGFTGKEAIRFVNELSNDILKQSMVNIFLDPDGIATFDQVRIEGIDLPAATGRGIWKAVNDAQWQVCERINRERLKKFGDEIPM